MPNDASGSFDLPFNAGELAKETEKQAKNMDKAIVHVTRMEAQMKAIAAARKRMRASGAASGGPPNAVIPWSAPGRGGMARLGQHFWDMGGGDGGGGGGSGGGGTGGGQPPRIGYDGGGYADFTLNGGGHGNRPPIRQSMFDKAGNAVGQFGARLNSAIEALGTFRGAVVGAAVAAGSAVVGGMVDRSKQAGTELGSLELLGGRMQRHLGMSAPAVVDMVKTSGDIAGSSAFLEKVLDLKTQGQLKTPDEVIIKGLQAIRNNEDPATVMKWLTSNQRNQIRKSSVSPLTGAAKLEMDRRAGAGRYMIESQQKLDSSQRDMGAYDDAKQYDMLRDSPWLAIPGVRQIASGLESLRPTDKSFERREDFGPGAPAGFRGPTPVRQPGYDVRGNGRTSQVLQVEIVGDRSRRPDPRQGNR